MTDTWNAIVAICSGLIVICTAVGLVVKFVLIPYLQKHLVTPVADVREQVKNSHKTNLRDDIDEIRKLLLSHLSSSEKSEEQIWSEIRRLKARMQRPDDN